MLFANSNYQVNKTHHLDSCKKACGSKSNCRNHLSDPLCRGHGWGMTSPFKSAFRQGCTKIEDIGGDSLISKTKFTKLQYSQLLTVIGDPHHVSD